MEVGKQIKMSMQNFENHFFCTVFQSSQNVNFPFVFLKLVFVVCLKSAFICSETRWIIHNYKSRSTQTEHGMSAFWSVFVGD